MPDQKTDAIEVDFLFRRRCSPYEKKERIVARASPARNRMRGAAITMELTPDAVDLPGAALAEDAKSLEQVAGVIKDLIRALGSTHMNSAEARRECEYLQEGLRTDLNNLRRVRRDLITLNGGQS